MTDLDIGGEEVVLRHQGGAEALGAEAHPVGLHVAGGVAALLGHALVDVGLEHVVAQLYGLVRAQPRGRQPRQLERQQGMALSETHSRHT